MRMLPNLLTYGRLILSLAMFASLIVIGAGVRGAPILDDLVAPLVWFSLAAFVVAALTDFLDGWLARRLGATSLTGAILDPIADKILVCGAIVGLLAVGMTYTFAALGGLILMRELAVSALREVLAPRGVKLPVTFLAKTKTTLQLIALAAAMALAFWPAFGFDLTADQLHAARSGSELLLALATAVTLWTGAEYARAAVRALRTPAAPPPPAGRRGAG